MPSKLCPICGEEISVTFFDRHLWREKRAIKALREEHPEWAGNGTAECIKAYKEMHEEMRSEARRLRQEHGETFDDQSDDVGDEIPETELHIATGDYDLHPHAED
ncbi:MAG TPA: hypothetical protein VFC63_17515 [Blastocatellia bacterium]|nr:hypothetical protein [Blastocatellia bacterium]